MNLAFPVRAARVFPLMPSHTSRRIEPVSTRAVARASGESAGRRASICRASGTAGGLFRSALTRA